MSSVALWEAVHGRSPCESLDAYEGLLRGRQVATPFSGRLRVGPPRPGDLDVITGSVDVPSGVTLSIAAGTVLKFSIGTELTVEGRVNAVAASSDPIVLTSVNNNWKSVRGIDSVCGRRSSTRTMPECSVGILRPTVTFGFGRVPA